MCKRHKAEFNTHKNFYFTKKSGAMNPTPTVVGPDIAINKKI